MSPKKKTMLEIETIMHYMDIDPVKMRQFINSLRRDASNRGTGKSEKNEGAGKQEHAEAVKMPDV